MLIYANLHESNRSRLVPGDFGGTILDGVEVPSDDSSSGVLVTVYRCLKPVVNGTQINMTQINMTIKILNLLVILKLKNKKISAEKKSMLYRHLLLNRSFKFFHIRSFSCTRKANF